jgi:hypothetical protein
MLTQVERIVVDATNRIIESVAAFMPGVLALVIIVVLSLVLAIGARLIVLRALRGLDFDERSARWGLTLLAEWSPSKSLSVVVARTVQWTILVLGLLIGLTALNAAIPSRFALTVFTYMPHLLAALIIIVIGTILAQFLSRAVLIGAVNMQIQSARALSLTVKWVVLVVAASMALEELSIGRQILVLAFAILFGGVVLAAALAIGLGARDAAGRLIERQFQQSGKKEQPMDHV